MSGMQFWTKHALLGTWCQADCSSHHVNALDDLDDLLRFLSDLIKYSI